MSTVCTRQTLTGKMMEDLKFADRHLDAYAEELATEIAELKGRTGNFGTLERQFKDLTDRYVQVQAQKSNSDQECSQKLFDGVQVIDSLVKELEQMRQVNQREEDTQITLLNDLSAARHDLQTCDSEFGQLRQELNSQQQNNEHERLQIEHNRGLLSQLQTDCHRQHDNMSHLREDAAKYHEDNEGLKIRIKGLANEIDNNAARIAHQSEVCQQKDNEIVRVNSTVVAGHNEIAQLKGDLRQIDNEICYVEDQNKRQQQAQKQMTKALEYEMLRTKEQSVNETDLNIKMQSRESEVRNIEHDLEGVSSQNTTMVADSNRMSHEIEALNQHIQIVTTQNSDLATELQQFLATDQVVKEKLSRKSNIDEIRKRVDAVIERSVAEIHRASVNPLPERVEYQQTQDQTQGIQAYRRDYDEPRVRQSGRSGSPLRQKSPPSLRTQEMHNLYYK